MLVFDQETQDWRKVGKKGAKRVAVSPDGTPWILNDENNIYRATSGGWKRVPGKATSITIGADGSVFILGPIKAKTGYKIYQLDREQKIWKAVPGRGMRLAVDFTGVPWVISTAQMIFKQTTEGWLKLTGRSKIIMGGQDGSMYVLDNTKTREGYGIWKWHSKNRSWKAINGRANFLAVGSDGKPYAIRANG